MALSIRRLWDRLAPLPGGKRAFSVALGRLAPYSGSIAPRVEELRPGYARVRMRDRRAVRNHLRSVHAIALMNLAELSSGLALTYSLPPDARAILTGLSIEFLKKARGTLTAEASLNPPRASERQEYAFESTIRDAGGDVVARAIARWLVSPKE
jgi:acyl-coenzyme A thioesterase PaaI-like protein